MMPIGTSAQVRPAVRSAAARALNALWRLGPAGGEAREGGDREARQRDEEEAERCHGPHP